MRTGHRLASDGISLIGYVRVSTDKNRQTPASASSARRAAVTAAAPRLSVTRGAVHVDAGVSGSPSNGDRPPMEAVGVLTFIYTKTGKILCVGGTPEIQACSPRSRAPITMSLRTRARARRTPGPGCQRPRDAPGSGRHRVTGRAFHLLRHALATRMVAGHVDIKTVAAILGHSRACCSSGMRTSLRPRKQAALATHPGTVGHILGTPGWAEQKVWTPTDEIIEEKVVDGRRLELPTSALRTRRSPS